MTPILRIPKSPRQAFPLTTFIVLVLLVAAFTLHREHRAISASPLRRLVPIAPTAIAHVLSLPHVSPAEQHAVDTVRDRSTNVALGPRGDAIAARRGTVISMSGWAADVAAHRPSAAVFATIGKRVYVGTRGVQRDDVASALGSPAYGPSGFEIAIDTASLPLGRSIIALGAVNGTGTGRYDLHHSIILTLTQ